jgi:hypothetical protein
MARLPVSGYSMAFPLRDEGELGRVISGLGVGPVLTPTAVHELYLNLALIIGKWLSEQQRLESSAVGGSLLSIAKGLNEACLVLDGIETGLHSDLEIAVATRIAEYLTLDPSGRSLAEAIVSHRQHRGAEAGLVDQPKILYAAISSRTR